MKIKTILSSFSALLFFVLLFSCQSKPQETIREKHPSGAAYSLDYWTYLRTYPDGQLHRKKYELAYQQKQLSTAFRDGGDDEFEALGPKNIGGRTLCIAFHPTEAGTIFAGAASGGLWKSTSGGVGVTAWEHIETGFPVLGVGAIAIQEDNPDVMYMGTGEVYNFQSAAIGNINRITRGTYGVGILKSEDGGMTWAKSLDWDLDDFTGVQDILINSANPSIVFAATNQGLYRSQDAGGNWEQIFTGMIVDLEFHPQNPDILYISQGNINSPTTGIYRSINGGDSFLELTNGLPAMWSGKTLIGISTSAPNEIYLSVSNAFQTIGLYKTFNGGDNWSQINSDNVAAHQGWYSHDVAVDPNDPSVLLYVGFNAWRSSDGGFSLNQVSQWDLWQFGQVPVGGPEGPPDYIHADIHQVKFHPYVDNLVYVVTDGGIFASVNNGVSWEGRNGGYQTQQFYANFSNSNTDSLFAIGGMQDNATALYIGDDAWVRVLGADGMCTAINQDNDDIVYGSTQYLGMRRSSNHGNNWSFTAPFDSEDPIFNAPFTLAPSDQSRLYAGSRRMHRSNNGGNSWTTPNNTIWGNNSILTIAVSPSNKDLLFASTTDFELNNPPSVAKSENGGTTWTNITGLPDRNAADIAFDPNDDQIVYTVFSGFNSNHVYKTINGGQSWISIDNGLPDVPTNSIVVDPLNTDILYVGNDLGVYCSIDGGNNWEVYSNGLPSAVLVMHLSISPSNRKLRVATHGSGIFQGDLIELPPVATNDLPNVLINDIKIYPNPVIDQSMIQFVLEEKSTLDLTLYGRDGKRIKQLFSGRKESGTHEMSFNFEELPTGVYYYTLSGGAFVKSVAFIKR